MADLGLAQLHDMRTNAEMIANLDPYGPPLIADMDTGYGGKQAAAHHTTHREPANTDRPSDGVQISTAIHPSRGCGIPH